MSAYRGPGEQRPAASPQRHECRSNDMRATERPRHRTVVIDGLDVFYREAGARDRPCVLLLHGFPSSSHSFRQVLSPVGAVSWVVAPDLPGFGFSAAPRV